MIAGGLAPRASVAIIRTRGILSADLDMRAVVLRVVTAETILADKAFTRTATAATASVTGTGGRLLATVGSCAGAGAR